MVKKAFAILLAIIMALPYAAVTVYGADASVSAFKGDVKIYKSGGAKSFKPFNGMKLAEGDTIETAAKSTLTVKSGKKTTTVGENSKVTVDSLWDSGNAIGAVVTVVSGSVLNKVEDTLNVNSKDQVRTANTIAGIRGTEYIFEYTRGMPVKIMILEGTVNLSDISGSVGKGHGSSAVNSSTVYFSTDSAFVNEYGNRFAMNPPENTLYVENVDKELLGVLYNDPETQVKYPELYKEIGRILKGADYITSFDDTESAINEIKKQSDIVRESTAKVLRDNGVSTSSAAVAAAPAAKPK